MKQNVELSFNLVVSAEKHAKANQRTTAEQIEYWCYLSKAAEDNPDLPLAFIKEALDSDQAIQQGEVSDFKFRNK